MKSNQIWLSAVYSSAVVVKLVFVYPQTVKEVLGPDIHARNIGKVHLVQFASEGVFGWIPTHTDFISQFILGD